MPKEQLFRLFGYAGTGRQLSQRKSRRRVQAMCCSGPSPARPHRCFQGARLRGASTIHSMIYRSRGTDEEDAPRLRAQQAKWYVRKAKLVIIDECSMVDEALGAIFSFVHQVVLVHGDPAHFRPCRARFSSPKHEPDVMLTEVHRRRRTIRSSGYQCSCARGRKAGARRLMARRRSSAAPNWGRRRRSSRSDPCRP